MDEENKVTVPPEIVARAGITPGSRLDWRLTSRPGVLEVTVLPGLAELAASVRGLGARNAPTADHSAVDDLVREREIDGDEV